MPTKGGIKCPFDRQKVPPCVTYCRVRGRRLRTSDACINRSLVFRLDRKFSIVAGTLRCLERGGFCPGNGHHWGGDQTDVLDFGGQRQFLECQHHQSTEGGLEEPPQR